VVDALNEADPIYLDAALAVTEMTIETGAFLMAGYVLVAPDRSGVAMDRVKIAAKAADENALEVSHNFHWLQAKFRVKRSKRRSKISPEELMAALHGPGAPPSIFPSLIWRAYRLLADDRAQRDAKLELAIADLSIAFDNGAGGTNDSRQSLYLMAVAAGAVTPGKSFHRSIKTVRERLRAAYKEVRTVHEARRASVPNLQPMVSEELNPPAENTLVAWFKAGADSLGFDPVEWKNGRPPKRG
jgi:hypothetical protein